MNSRPFNYLFFGSFWIMLMLITSYQVLLVPSTSGSKFFFLLFAWGQDCLEVVAAIVIGWLIQHYLGRKLFLVYIGGVFLLFLAHIVDFAIHQMFGFTVWDYLGLVLDEDPENFLEMLYASGVPLSAWILGGVCVLLLPLVGIFIYLFSERISKRKPLTVKKELLVQSFLTIPMGLFIWDASASRIFSPDTYSLYVKSLPWKTTFLEPSYPQIFASHPLKQPKDEKKWAQDLEKISWKPEKKPNIYLFILESLREDFITDIYTPHFAAFKKEEIAFDLSLANANGTHISWFSLFFSDYPFLWASYRKAHWKSGSTSLQLLKKMGYQIHVYSSAALGYYGMEELLFGENHHLADSFHAFKHYHPLQAYQTDGQTVATFEKELEEGEGHVHIFFWDSSHFDYSWPKENPYPFLPVSKAMDYFFPTHSEYGLELIKNRYRNALYYLDSLFARIQDTLQKKGLWENAIMVVTGDHGEEFCEHGRLFHASHLNHQQTNTPIYYKFPGLVKEDLPPRRMTCHMEIFPSILSYLVGKNENLSSFFEGRSIFNQEGRPFAITSRYYASRAPYEFSLDDGEKKVIARFKDKKDIFLSKGLDVIALKNRTDQEIYLQKDIGLFIQEEFTHALQEIFPSALGNPQSP